MLSYGRQPQSTDVQLVAGGDVFSVDDSILTGTSAKITKSHSSSSVLPSYLKHDTILHRSECLLCANFHNKGLLIKV